MRIRSKTCLARYRRRMRCDYCNRPTPEGCDPSHVFSRGAGGSDIDWNILALCRGWYRGVFVSCHNDHHAGRLLQCDLIAKLAAREGVLQADIRRVNESLRNLPQWASPEAVEAILAPMGAIR